jgi:succinate-acetate transporter protein
MGNFLPMMICGMFAVFWLSFGTLQLPTWQIAESYSASGTNAAEGAATVGYNAGIALYLIVWGFTLATFFVFTLKTNTVFALIFFCVDVGVWCLSAAYWKVASGDYDTAAKLQKVIPDERNTWLTSRREGRFHLWWLCWAGISQS